MELWPIVALGVGWFLFELGEYIAVKILVRKDRRERA